MSRCEHGMLPGLCVTVGCPAYEGEVDHARSAPRSCMGGCGRAVPGEQYCKACKAAGKPLQHDKLRDLSRTYLVPVR